MVWSILFVCLDQVAAAKRRNRNDRRRLSKNDDDYYDYYYDDDDDDKVRLMEHTMEEYRRATLVVKP